MIVPIWFAIFYLALFGVGILGWVFNIVALVGMLDGAVTALFLARIVGVFVAPLGAVLGWLV